jgi:imidazolonepropionase-like amidohydrolase
MGINTLRERGIQMGLVLKNGNLIDGTGKVVKDAVVVIEGSTIVAASPAGEVRIPEGKNQIIDVAGMTIMPGLMDLHDHLHGDGSEFPGGTPHDRFGETVSLSEENDAYLTVLMVENAKKALEAGFTTIRDTGSPRDLTIDIARAERDGLFVGPRILAAATIDITYPPSKKRVHGVVGGDITGPVEAVKAVREKIGSGADWIHLRATGASAGQWGPEVELLTVEEMRAAIEETHRLGKRTTTNALGSKGIRNAVIAGVQCIEHGTYLHEDNDLIKMMAERRVGFVPTFIVNIAQTEAAKAAEARGEKIGLPEYWVKRGAASIEHRRRSFEKAMEAGVPVAIGADTGAPRVVHGKNAIEMEIFVRYGASEMEAIEAGTRVAAEVLGMEDRLGTVEAGKEADVIVVKEDPLKDIRVLQENENVVLVIKGGEIVVDRRGGFRAK